MAPKVRTGGSATTGQAAPPPRNIHNVYWLAKTIEALIGLKLFFPNRAKIWDMLLYFRKKETYQPLSLMDFIDAFPTGLGNMSIPQLTAAYVSFYCEKESSPYLFTDSQEQEETEDWKHWSRLTYQFMDQLLKLEGNESVHQFLRQLLDLGYTQRTVLAQRNSIRGKLAEVSLHELPPVLAGAYSVLTKEDFWTIWDSLETD